MGREDDLEEGGKGDRMILKALLVFWILSFSFLGMLIGNIIAANF